MKNKILSMLAVLAVAVNMVGCAPSDSSAPVEATEQVVEETELSETKQALTFDEVNRIEINGVEVSLPFKIEDLGEGYSIKEERWTDEVYYNLCYFDEEVAFVDTNDKEIISIKFTSEDLEKHTVKFHGLTSSNNFKEIINIIGEPSIKTEIALLYNYNNGRISFISENEENGFNYLEISLNGGIENNQ